MPFVTARVSVIVPAYNVGRFLGAALASIERQQHPDLELIVVDDGSTDDTAAVIAACPVVTIALRQPNAGPSRARNRGIAAATGEHIAFLDGDDLWPDGRLDRQLAALDARPDVDGVLGRIQYVATDGGRIPRLPYEDPRLHTIVAPSVAAGLFRRRSFERVGPFDEELRSSEDLDWLLRASEAGLDLRVLPDVTLVYRHHDANSTGARAPAMVNRALMVRKAHQRRRGLDLPTFTRWPDWDA